MIWDSRRSAPFPAGAGKGLADFDRATIVLLGTIYSGPFMCFSLFLFFLCSATCSIRFSLYDLIITGSLFSFAIKLALIISPFFFCEGGGGGGGKKFWGLAAARLQPLAQSFFGSSNS